MPDLDGSHFTDCKICQSLMTKEGHEDGLCCDCRREKTFGIGLRKPLVDVLEAILARLQSIDATLKEKR